MTTSILYTTTDAPSEALAAAVDRGLEEHNITAAPSLHEVRPLSVSAANEDGVLVGGALGRTWGSCCELQELWVTPASRQSGVGSNLLVEFEHAARQRGCKTFYLTTLSFQAPAFYEKHGYEAKATIAGYPEGIVKYLMLKDVT